VLKTYQPDQPTETTATCHVASETEFASLSA